tara:strand:+ start:21 stop:731 length:711 start_codon:yes stop_codon:yes gene_type:complete
MSQIKLKHSSGNGVILAAPASNPASDITFKLPQADGSANEVLKTDGSGNLSFAGAGDYLKLDSGSGTSGGSVIAFDNLDLTTYRAFDILIFITPVTDGEDVRFRFRDGGSSGADVTTSSYIYGGDEHRASFAESIDAQETQNHIRVAQSVGSGSHEGAGINARVHFATSSDTGDLDRLTNRVNYDCNFKFSGGGSRFSQGIGHFSQDASKIMTGFSFSFTSGNIAEYIYCLYGIKR